MTQNVPKTDVDPQLTKAKAQFLQFLGQNDSTFKGAECKIGAIPEASGSFQTDANRLCGHAVFKNPEWTVQGHRVLSVLRHSSEACNRSYATHLSQSHQNLSTDDIHAFIGENRDSRAHLCRMHQRCEQDYHGCKQAPYLLSAINSLVALMDKNGGIAALMAAFHRNEAQGACGNDGSKRCRCKGCCTTAPHACTRHERGHRNGCYTPAPDAYGRDDRCHPDSGRRARGGCTPEPDAYARDDRCHPDSGRRARGGCTPEPGAYARDDRCPPCDDGGRYAYGGCTQVPDAYGGYGRYPPCHADERSGCEERFGPLQGGDRDQCYHPDAVSANNDTQVLRRAHRNNAERPCCCQGP